MRVSGLAFITLTLIIHMELDQLLVNNFVFCKRKSLVRDYRRFFFLQGNKKGYSFTWQSLVSWLLVFLRGHIWRVGDGLPINIWDDCWIPNTPTSKVLTPRGHALLTKFEELIDAYSGQWDEELIRQKNPS